MSQNWPVESIGQRIECAWPVARWQNTPTVVAVSGGPDSVALLHALVKLSKSARPQLIVAHVNHNTRGAASDSDAKFVEELADHLSLPFYLGTSQSKKGQGQSESQLRNFRYRCLREAAARHSARYIATGHTLDDQIETLLFRIFRGTGMRGLQGIPVFRKLSDELTLVRPMLTIKRSEIKAYLNEIDQPHCIDDSNHDSRYTRNFLRNELLPLARQKFPNVDRAIACLSEAARDHVATLPSMVDSSALTYSSTQPSKITINCESLGNTPANVIINALIEVWDELGWSRGNINRATWQKVARLIGSDSHQRQTINLPGNIKAERKDGTLILTRPQDQHR